MKPVTGSTEGSRSARRASTDCAAIARILGVLAGPVLILVAMASHAVPICRWVDDSGRTHVSDIVPERYLQIAQCRDSRQYEISPDRVIEAQEQVRDLTQRAGLSGDRSSDPAGAPAAASAPASQRSPSTQAVTSTKRPARGVDASTDCTTWRRLYEESGDCFGPYRTVGGGIKAEAFEKCRPIPSPDLQCGPAVIN